MSEFSRYTFVDGNDDNLDITLNDYAEAREYAITNQLAVVENVYEWVDSNVIDDFRERDEPEEDDYTTEDHRKWYQSHKLVLNLGKDDDWRKAVAAHMEKEQYWPSVWFISDHGNAHRLSMSEE